MFICDISVFNKYGKQKLDESLRPMNMDWHELVVLMVLEQLPGISQSRLVPFLQTDKANVTKILQIMEKKGLLFRETDPSDQRNKVCKLTEEGMGFLPSVHQAMSDWEKLCYQGISEEELALFRKVGKTITKNLVGEWES